MENLNTRTELLLGTGNLEKLANSSVAIFGLGGVGGACCEALARSGIGRLLLYDCDTVRESNLNRLTGAEKSDVGMLKTEFWKNRIQAIAPNIEVELHNLFLKKEVFENLAEELDVDFCVDAIDTLNSKVALIKLLKRKKIKFISAMGAAGRLDPSLVRYGRLESVRECGLASRVRYSLRKSGIDVRKIRVVHSLEKPLKPEMDELDADGKGIKHIQPSYMPVPVTFGMFLAYATIAKLLGIVKK